MVGTHRKNRPAAAKKKGFFQITRKGVVFWIFLIVAVSAWTFTLGVLVGRDTAPLEFDIKQLEKKLRALKAEDLKEKLKRFKIYQDAEEKEPELGFYEALKTEQSDIQLPASLPKRDAAPTPPGPPPKDASPKTVTKISDPKPVEPTRKKPSAGNSKSLKKAAIQVASIKDPKDADRMVAMLKNKGYPAYKAIGKVPGKGIWFRVRVGPYDNNAEAQGILNRLKKDKFNGFILNIE